MSIEVWVAAFVVMLASLSGVFFLQKTAERFLQTRLSYLVSFSAGVFLVTAGGLGLEVFEIAPSIWQGVILIALGYVGAFALHTLLPETHQHHDPACNHGHGLAAKKIIIGDAIHNVTDGVILVVAFSTLPALGIAATVSIMIHEVLQEISEFFVLKQAGYSNKKALLINFAVSSTILAGVGIGYFVSTYHELEVVLLALSAGFFSHVVLHDLLPKREDHQGVSQFFKHVLLVLIGALLMGTVASLLGEGH